jgi:hypothetical protein
VPDQLAFVKLTCTQVELSSGLTLPLIEVPENMRALE